MSNDDHHDEIPRNHDDEIPNHDHATTHDPDEIPHRDHATTHDPDRIPNVHHDHATSRCVDELSDDEQMLMVYRSNADRYGAGPAVTLMLLLQHASWREVAIRRSVSHPSGLEWRDVPPPDTDDVVDLYRALVAEFDVGSAFDFMTLFLGTRWDVTAAAQRIDRETGETRRPDDE
jgi:hypothetical protein